MRWYAFLIPLLLFIPIASAQYNQSFSFGSFGGGEGQFYGLSGITLDDTGNVYVTELDNRVQSFNSVISIYNIPARRIAIDSSGDIYATVNNTVQKYSQSGQLLSTYSGFNFPIGIDIDSSGNIYIADTNNNRIVKIDPVGNVIATWGGLGTENGKFNSPIGIAIDDGIVYVADTGNNRIQKFSLNGVFISSVGTEGNGEHQFNGCTGIAVDPNHNIYIADYLNNRVLEYDSNFQYVTEYIGMSYPIDVVATQNSLYIADSGNYRVKVYSDREFYDFTSSAVSGTTPARIKFYDTSIFSSTNYYWDFDNDGTIDSTQQNPIKTFSRAGNYTVNLTVENVYGSFSVLKSNYIIITDVESNNIFLKLYLWYKNTILLTLYEGAYA